MRRKIKKLAVFTTVVVVVLSVLGVVKYLNIELDSAVNTGHNLTLTLPSVPLLSTYLNSRQYRFNIENVCITGFVFLLLVSRGLLIRKATN